MFAGLKFCLDVVFKTSMSQITIVSGVNVYLTHYTSIILNRYPEVGLPYSYVGHAFDSGESGSISDGT